MGAEIMTDTKALIERCYILGADFSTIDGHLVVRAPEPLPDDLVTELKQVKSQILAELKRQRSDALECWMLAEWRRISTPEWRRILQESIEKHDDSREKYARWMLSEVLLDAEYKEGS
jgi:hypothetical protein